MDTPEYHHTSFRGRANTLERTEQIRPPRRKRRGQDLNENAPPRWYATVRGMQLGLRGASINDGLFDLFPFLPTPASCRPLSLI